jgi:hypothetical protein
MRTANLERGIKDAEFQSRKEHILILHHLLKEIGGLSSSQVQSLADAVFGSRDVFGIRDKEIILGLLKQFEKEGSPWHLRVYQATVGRIRLSKEELLWREACNFAASQYSDSRFLSEFRSSANSCLYTAIDEAEETAYAYLAKKIKSLESGIHQQILSTQKEECNKQAQLEVKSEEDKELRILRSDFARQIEDLSRERSKSYVPTTFSS